MPMIQWMLRDACRPRRAFLAEEEAGVPVAAAGSGRRARRRRRQQDAVPGRLDRAEGAEQDEPDAGVAGQEAAVVDPTELGIGADDLADRAPGLPAGDALAGAALGHEALDPGQRRCLEEGIAGRLEEPVVEMGEAGGAVTEAAVDDAARLRVTRCGRAGDGDGLALPFRLAGRAGGAEQRQGDSRIAITPR